MFSGLAVTTASGAIKFAMLKEHRDELHEEISKLLVERQSKPTAATTTIKQEIPQSNADELKKYKDLLDGGIISQEEFDAKKKQLLGLVIPTYPRSGARVPLLSLSVSLGYSPMTMKVPLLFRFTYIIS